ncbi:MAG: hypothetical protein JSW40_03530 [Candidatus Omnitrophota bacterium]|nr:MAG: hypothetical protein JSW40_03530 [Candidatus Omnitrophota bacterium]
MEQKSAEIRLYGFTAFMVALILLVAILFVLVYTQLIFYTNRIVGAILLILGTCFFFRTPYHPWASLRTFTPVERGTFLYTFQKTGFIIGGVIIWLMGVLSILDVFG